MASKTNNNIDENAHNGLQTKLWGPSLWTGLHSITFGYPLEPTDEDKKNYKSFFEQLKYVLPCKYCRDSYTEYIAKEPTKLTNEVLENRSTLTKWLYDLHNRVNNKLDTEYGTTYEEVVEKYESFRAKCDPNDKKGCNMPMHLKAESYRHYISKDCPIIDYELASKFKSYAEKRGIEDFNLLEECFKYKQMKIKSKKCSEWENRNKECADIISKMKLDGISAIEKTGEYAGLPSIPELKLIARLCSTLGKAELEKVSNKLNMIEIKKEQSGGSLKVYKFKKL